MAGLTPNDMTPGAQAHQAKRDTEEEKQRCSGEKSMTSQTFNPKFDRRTLIKGAAALGAFQVASPFIIQARGEMSIRIGMVDPLTGVYAAPAANEEMRAKLAADQITAQGVLFAPH